MNNEQSQHIAGNEFPLVEGTSTYIGTKISKAKAMNRQDYNDFRGWDLPDNENGDDDGYLVQYTDGYISWSPKMQFEEAYELTSGMSFGLAIEAMKKGLKVARSGWNGKGMFCIYVPGTKSVGFTVGSPYEMALRGIADADKAQEILPHFDMYTVNADGRRAFLPGWLASQSDMDATDWSVID